MKASLVGFKQWLRVALATVLSGSFVFVEQVHASSLDTLLEDGRIAFHEGDFTTARRLLSSSLELSTDNVAREDSRHLLVASLLALNDDPAVIAEVTRALEAVANGDSTTVLMDELHMMRAKALERLGRYEAAVADYDAVLADSLSPHRSSAAFARARALEHANNWQGAIEAYRDFIKTWPASPSIRDVRLGMARALKADKRATESRAVLRRLVADAPRSRAGRAAATELGTASVIQTGRFASLSRVQRLFRDRQFARALPILNALREEARATKDRALEGEVVRLTVRALGQTRQEKEALAMLPELRRLGMPLPSVDQRIEWTALAGDFSAAEKLLLSRHRNKKNAYYWRQLGDLRFEFGRYEGAFKAYRKSRRKKTRKVDGKRVDDITPRMAWSLIGMGKPERAMWYLEKRRARGRRNKQSKRYWLARAHQLSGRTQKALAGYDDLASEAPYEYYGIMAYSRALEMRGEAPEATAVADAIGPMVESLEGAEGLEPSGTILWSQDSLTGRFDEAPQPASRHEQLIALADLSSTWGALLPETARAFEYARLGFVDRAIAELRVVNSDLRAVRRGGPYSLLKRGRNDLLDNRRRGAARGGAVLSEGRRLRDNKSAWVIKRKRRAIRNALRNAQVSLGDPYGLRRQAFETRHVPRTDVDIELWKQVYPTAFPEFVSRFASDHGVPPYFVYSIMTVESTFHPCAVSVANAYGLLQVIPRTGRRIAAALDYGEFTPEVLLEPETSIYFGTYYLGALLKKFRGQELLAAAAYNAGPHRVDRWLRQNPNRDMDLFIEHIPYSQAKNYARSVLEKVARYRRTYHGEERIYVSNRLATESRLQPNY